MTQKQKAIALVNSFESIIPSYPDYVDVSENEIARQCALIAVDEIILSNPHSNPFNTEIYSTMDYWQQVKEELENL